MTIQAALKPVVIPAVLGIVVSLSLPVAGRAQSPICREYCENVMGEGLGQCVDQGPGKNYQIYETVEQCYAVCSTFPDDAPADAVSGDSVQCRNEHAKLAQGPEGPRKHCPHAAPLGGGVCVDRSPCEAYCVFYYDRVSERSHELDCPVVPALQDDREVIVERPIGGQTRVKVGAGIVEQGSGRFIPSEACLEVCSGFAEAGEPFEISGDSANCRQQLYLMAHQIDPLHEGGLTRRQQERKDSLCANAHPFDSKLCTGSRMNMFFNVREVFPCKELCYMDWLACDSSYGTQETCLKTCDAFPELGRRGDTSGDSVYCRLSWAQNAFFVHWDEPEQAKVFCGFAASESVVCRGGSAAPGLHSH